MFKYFKYEYLSQLKYNIYIFISIIIVEMFLLFSNTIRLFNNLTFNLELLLMLCAIGIQGVFFYLCIKSFVTDLYDGRAYLLFSFPISTYNIVISKLAVVTINTITLYLCATSLQYFYQYDSLLFLDLIYGGVNALKSTSVIVIIWLFSIIYLSIIIMHTITKRRKLLPLYVLIAILLIWPSITTIIHVINYLPYYNYILYIVQLILLIQTVLFIIVSAYLLDKKLEL